MKKSLFAIAFSGVMLTSATAIACSDIPNPSRFMPTELSEFQMCVLDEHEEANAGVMGGLMWVRLADGSYFSTQFAPVMRKANGRTENAINIVTEYIVQEVTAEVTTVADQLRDLGISERKIANKMEAMIVRKLRGDNFAPRGDSFFKGKRNNPDASGYIADNISPVQAGNLANFAKNNGDFDNTGMVRYILVDSNEAWHVEFRAEVQAFIEGAVTDAYEAGYSDGYSDGFADGYRAGYADGFADGVASQQ